MKNGPVIKYKVGEEPPRDTPVQYLKGWVEFYKLKFKVTPDVLIPRPETELLVDEVLKFAANHSPLTILDLGTGSGNIAISIAKNLKNARIFATDISEEVLDIARENAKKHKVEDKIFFIKSNLLSVILEGAQRPIESRSYQPLHGFQDDNLIIVTNLPYIPSARIPYLDPSVKDFEPRVALDGGPDGFNLYRQLFTQLRDRGMSPKLLIGEIDYTQADIALNEAHRFFPKALAEVKTDLAHKQRLLLINF